MSIFFMHKEHLSLHYYKNYQKRINTFKGFSTTWQPTCPLINPVVIKVALLEGGTKDYTDIGLLWGQLIFV